MKRIATACLAFGVTLVLSACTSPPDGQRSTIPPATSTPTSTEALPGPVQPVGQPEVIASDLELPWSLVRLSTGSTLVSERDTALVKEVRDDGSVREVGGVAGVQPAGEGGLLGLEVSNDERWLYAYVTTASHNRVIRMPLQGDAGDYSLGRSQDVVTGIPKSTYHNGGRIKFGPDGLLYITTGDAGDGSASQDTGSLAGKILRVEPDGSIPDGNPFGNAVYSYGHRNVQGIDWDDDGRLWSTEFGQNTWDELNIIERGGNYGWPHVEGVAGADEYINPVLQWRPEEASPSGLLATRETLFAAALRGERLWTIYTTADGVEPVAYFTGEFGRMRDVIDGPEGTIWVATSNTGRSPRDGDDKILQIRIDELREG